ncbi:MAG: (2Fe-2S)-binding protein [Bacillota bacterium]
MIEGQQIPIVVTVNGVMHQLAVSSNETLAQMLRDTLGLTGTKESCGKGECGACTVLLNGVAVNSCLVLAAEVDGCEVLTIEGLSKDGSLDPLQQAFIREGAIQCGFCTPGMIMAAKALLLKNPRPTRQEVAEALVGNICRCTGYESILRAVMSCVEESSNNTQEHGRECWNEDH